MKRLVTSRRLLVRQVFSTVSILILLTALAQGQDLFEADNSSIYKFTPDGTRSTFASGLDEIFSLACDNEGNLFVSSGISYNSNLYKFTPDGTRSTFASGHPFYGMAFNSAGNLFAADSGGIIYQFTPSGARSIFASGLSFSLKGLACDSADDLFVLEGGYGPIGGDIYKFAPSGTRSSFASGLDNPMGLACDNEGNLFVSSLSTSPLQGNVYKFTPDGTRSTFASLPSPFGLACDSADNLFVADTVSGRILKFTPGGTRSTFASGLDYPWYLAFQPIPEPATLLLLGLGAVILRKRKK